MSSRSVCSSMKRLNDSGLSSKILINILPLFFVVLETSRILFTRPERCRDNLYANFSLLIRRDMFLDIRRYHNHSQRNLFLIGRMFSSRFWFLSSNFSAFFFASLLACNLSPPSRPDPTDRLASFRFAFFFEFKRASSRALIHSIVCHRDALLRNSRGRRVIDLHYNRFWSTGILCSGICKTVWHFGEFWKPTLGVFQSLEKNL